MGIRTIDDVLTEDDIKVILEAAKIALDDPGVTTDLELAFDLPSGYLKGLNSRVNYILGNKLHMNE